MRLFLAIKPDRPAEALIARRLMEVQAGVGDIAGVLRWIPATNIHITLQFLGEVPPTRMTRLIEVLGKTLDETSFDVELGGLGAFPSTGAPRVVWLDVVNGSAAIDRIHTELGRRLIDAGFPVESRPLSPHVTIARVPDRDRARVKALRDRLQTVAVAPIAWTADRVILFRSDLSGSVPRYEGLHDIELAG